MALPITGPITQSVNTPQEYLQRSRYRQKKPFNLQLSYAAKGGRTRTFNYPTNPDTKLPSLMFYTPDWTAKAVPQAQTKAYERLKAAISDRASMGENLGQLGSSVRLIAEKARLVAESVKRLRRLDVSAFAMWMDKGFVKRNTRFAAQLTLEVNFAIKPSIDDIYSAINILQEPIKSTMVKGRATVPYWDNSIPAGPASAGYSRSMNVSAEYGAMVAISNPNLFLANALGLINPVQTAWQLLPGSFLVDWLIPVEQFLGSASDFYGLRVESSYTTWFARGYARQLWTTYGWEGTADIWQVQRTPGISLPSLTLRPLKTPSLKRAANAVSLAIQAFVK